MRILLGEAPHTIWSIITLVVFFLFFIALTVWVFHSKNRARYRAIEQFPLDDDDLKKR